MSFVTNGIQELDPQVCYKRLVQKLVRTKQTAEIEILQTPPTSILQVKMKSGDKRKLTREENGSMLMIHNSQEGEEGIYRCFLSLLQQLKNKRYKEFWLDLSTWEDKELKWPEIHLSLIHI